MPRIRIIAVLLAVVAVSSCAAMEQEGEAAFRNQNTTIQNLTALSTEAIDREDSKAIKVLDVLETKVNKACAALQERAADEFSGIETCFLRRIWLGLKAFTTTERCAKETEEVNRELSSPPYAREVLVRVP